MSIKFISWNIDSLNAALQAKTPRAQLTYDILQEIAEEQPDFLAIQEPKLKPDGLTSNQEEKLDLLFPNYIKFVNPSTARSGYSGTMFLAKHNPKKFEKVKIGAPQEMDDEGRLITLEFDNFYLSTVYTPNSGAELKRLADREIWDQHFREYLQKLDQQKPVIISGDFNVAHQEIDLKNPKTNHHSAGFTDQERQTFDQLLASGFSDSWRQINPEVEGVYTWWTQIAKNAKQNNAGWRIDYYLVSDSIKNKIKDVGVIDTGSRADHAPIFLEMDNLTI